VAAIPDTGGARCAPHGVTSRGVTIRGVTSRALLRVVVLGGLVVAGWLLGSGTGLAQEGPGHEDLARTTGLVGLIKAPPPDGVLGGRFGAPSMVESTIRSLMRAAPVPRLAMQPPAHVPVLTPVLARVAEHVSAPVLKPVSRPAAHAAAAQSRAVVDKPAAVDKPTAFPLPGPVVQTELQPALASATLQSATGHPTVGDVPLATPVSAAAHPVADHLAEPLALGSNPAAPVPTSPPGATTAACPVGSSGGGATTKSACFVTFGDRQAIADLVLIHRLHASSGSVPRSAAEQPSSSPD
ncbi:MAG TPA: hypothetical protein VGO16_02870, partial [Pseudonocardiaceae bacterium]|nr:hypothetical protein [Pseudonocardiaceae bacterium]